MWLGDFKFGSTVHFKFTTVNSTGAATAFSSGGVTVYRDASTVQDTTGVTLTSSFDTITGLNHVQVDMSTAGFYSSAGTYAAVVSSGAASENLAGYVLAHWSLLDRAPLTSTLGIETLSTAGLETLSTVGLETVSTVGLETVSTVGLETLSTAGLETASSNVSVAEWRGTIPSTLGPNANLQVSTATLISTAQNIATVASVTADVNVSTGSEASITDSVWDEPLTGATHNVPNSAGRRLRQLERGLILHESTAFGGVATPNTVILDAAASTRDDFYNHARIVIVEGTGVEQERIIVNYIGATKTAKIAPPWIVTPATTDVFEIEPALSHAETGWATVKVGIVQTAGASTTVKLDAEGSTIDDYFNGDVIKIDNDGSTGAEGQSRLIIDYDGSSKIVFVDTAFTAAPTTAAEYIIEDGLASVSTTAVISEVASVTNAVSISTGSAIDSVTSVNSTVDSDVRQWLGAAPSTLGPNSNLQISTATLISTAQTIASVSTSQIITLSGLNSTLASSDVNAEVVDAIATDTYEEPSFGVPSTAQSFSGMLSHLFSALRNGVTVGSSAKVFYGDSTNILWSKVLSDDGTTYREESASTST